MIDSWSVYLSPSPSSVSSHLSVFTSSSSVSCAAGPSPLPSPSGSVTSIGSKTHAFFASPFSSAPTPAPPPNPSRSSSLASRTSHTSADDDSSSDAESDIKPRSLNADFFSPPPLPTPPSSNHSVSRDSSPTNPKLSLPPLSRFFPSRRRYNTVDIVQSSHTPFGSRRFLDLDVVSPTALPTAPTHLIDFNPSYTASPVENTESFPGLPSATTTLSIASDVSMPTPVPRQEAPSYIATHPDITPADAPAESMVPGQTLRDGALELELVRALGHGAFSSVWLARDVRGGLGPLELSRRTSLQRSRSERRGRTHGVCGTRPIGPGGVSVRREARGAKHEEHQNGARTLGRLVAVKMTERAQCEKNMRSRVSFVREVEILRHISHPSIVPFVHAFNTPSHHCLVLAHASGGELFELVASPPRHAQVRMPLLRRIFGELCKAVGWMHSVGLVHRDIKLENILLTADPLRAAPALPAPLVQLGDFGLARFVDPADPLLTTLCGSESYAAPELATARRYDGRATDAWACGVVLYALATRRLPFDRPRASAGMCREADETGLSPPLPPPVPLSAEAVRAERRALLLRIAKGGYAWPEDAEESLASPARSLSELAEEGALEEEEEEEEDEDADLAGLALARSAGVRRVVARLLVRDPRQRAAVAELWDEDWMHGKGAPATHSPASSSDGHAEQPMPASGADTIAYPDAGPDADADADDEGVLVDEQDIGPGSVACQEH